MVQNRRPPRLIGCFTPRLAVLLTCAVYLFRSPSLSSSLEDTAFLVFFGGGSGDDDLEGELGLLRDGGGSGSSEVARLEGTDGAGLLDFPFVLC